jgi:hypothetical protein
MPTELYINPKENDLSRPHIINPGANAVFHDHSNGKDIAIGVRCAEDDSQTDVYRSDNSVAPRINSRRVKKLADPLFFPGNREASVYSGQEFPMSFMDRRGRAVRLIIKHAGEQYGEDHSPKESGS